MSTEIVPDKSNMGNALENRIGEITDEVADETITISELVSGVAEANLDALLAVMIEAEKQKKFLACSVISDTPRATA